MFCPNCGTETREALKFCKKCGLNLRRVQGVMSKGGAGFNAATDWNQIWLEDYQEERERKKRKTPEEKRVEEIKAGVITASIGVAVTIFLSFLFDAIANSVGGTGANILRSIWAAGLIPLFVGLGLIFNGLIVSKRLVEMRKQQMATMPQPTFSPIANTSPVPQLPASSIDEAAALPISEFSISEPTTAKLREPIPMSQSRDTN
ncbi:MAG: zinc ribbon domain-containing protein [Acidobacteria bacterium]|nr:zinc ribbon domain-containing protein [Acidobacteriota bacterium]